ncbi:type I restriction enzyme S subunit [Pseudomonas hunanensis]|uniref:Type I restriction enzyme S subunit n=1 Tax=Pseudomonas hunanensis TaxID=1247546 RepID=A0ACC6JYK1_9PSED|nr:restriction endonuclease subunit S [Pseudomonas hunanensis]MDR6711270.1 type I restriction enzyme S subunit [Pseudomonas hunanensis]
MGMKPGYKQTDLGIVPETWRVEGLGSFWSITDCKHITAQFVANGYPLASIREVQSRYVNLDGAKQTSRQFYSLLIDGGRKPRSGDLIMSRNATVGEVAQVADWHPEFAMGQDVCLLRKKAEGLSTDYMQSVFGSPIIGSQILDLMVGSTFKRVNVQQIRNLVVPIPPTSEQQAIAKVLSDADSLIESLEQLLVKKRQIKQGAMQELLTGQRRLPGFSGAWGVKRLGTICDISMGRTPSRLNSAFWGAGYVWLSISDLKSKVVSTSKEEVTPLAAAAMRSIRKGTLLMSFKLSIGRLCFAGCDLFTNEAICSFNNPRANTDFLYYMLGRTDFSLYGKQAVKGFTLNKESLMSVEVPYPSLEEQTAIASVLSAMDGEISTLETKLKNVRHLKQGMMQELLTGRIRLV